MTTAIGTYCTAALLKARTGISDTTDDTVLGSICDQVNAYIESPEACNRVIAPVSSAVYTFDGDGSTCIRYRNGIRSVSKLEVAQFTGGAYVEIPSTEFFLRPGASDRTNGWPAMRIELSDRAATIGVFPKGFDTVRVTMVTGWAAIPDEITDVALTAATRAWHGVQSGQIDIVGTDEMGKPLVSRFFSLRDKGTLRAYSLNLPG